MGLIEFIILILIIFWVFGLLTSVGGSAIHFLLIVCLLLFLYRLYTGRTPS